MDIRRTVLLQMLQEAGKMWKACCRHLTLLALLCAACCASGCSVIGFTIGAVVDAKTPDTTRYSVRNLDSIPPGTSVTVIRKDSSFVEGAYGGINEIPQTQYAAAYTQYRLGSPLGNSLPALGDSIRVITRSTAGRRGMTEALFEGFDPAGVRLVTGKLRLSASLLAVFVDTLYTTGRSIDGERLRQGLNSGIIPLITRELHIALENGNVVSLPVDEVLEVKGQNSHVAKFYTLGMGLALDAVAFWAMSNMEIR